ncbi:hypothetical protein N9Y94_02780, partial [Alphaproteobacteria bacterium]|nr:hypothetical protein [Alphaproteobacteria bacterium]
SITRYFRCFGPIGQNRGIGALERPNYRLKTRQISRKQAASAGLQPSYVLKNRQISKKGRPL